ncbi:hypothetical protein AVEN_68473-1 [Araneus ventricosus]|uniref:Peptidase A2 domain-containing protein n=1 Tax=Araneus ventricosus TaxID=182803 RepID=A0A4Y2S0Y7_ARAVE|nr:hypothetical protein AVEN_68473-1 [Araneus ventricosus]
MEARYGIFEVHRMADGVVHVTLLRQRSVGLPAVRKNSGPRRNIFFGDFDQRLCRSILNHAKKTSLLPLSIPPNTQFYFHSLTFMQEGQAIECYVTQLKTLASTCEFEEQENGLIRDRIVLGIGDSGLKERLLRESGLGLEKAIEVVRAAETSREQLRSRKEETPATVNSVKRNRSQNQPKQSSQEYECKKCGRNHKPREYPAYGKMCTKKNHFAAKCFQNSKNIHEMKVPENELDIYIDSVTEKVQENELNSDSMNKNVEIVSEAWYKSVTLNANDKYFEVDFKLDTGAEVNILPL